MIKVDEDAEDAEDADDAEDEKEKGAVFYFCLSWRLLYFRARGGCLGDDGRPKHNQPNVLRLPNEGETMSSNTFTFTFMSSPCIPTRATRRILLSVLQQAEHDYGDYGQKQGWQILTVVRIIRHLRGSCLRHVSSVSSQIFWETFLSCLGKRFQKFVPQ